VQEAITAYVACQTGERASPRTSYRSIAAFRQAQLLIQLHHWQDAEVCLRACARDASDSKERALQLNALRILLGVYQALRRPDQVLEVARQAFPLAGDQGDEATQALIWDVEGDAYLALGKSDEALDDYERSLDLFHRVGNLEAEWVVKQDIARLYQVSGQWEKAIRWLDILLREEQVASDHVAWARTAYDLACLHIHTGDLQRASGYLQQSMGQYRQAENRSGADLVGRTMIGLGILMHRQATADWLTFADIKRRSGTVNQEEE
jgi:tetratricopeptide (TPR) repeat protein